MFDPEAIVRPLTQEQIEVLMLACVRNLPDSTDVARVLHEHYEPDAIGENNLIESLQFLAQLK